MMIFKKRLVWVATISVFLGTILSSVFASADDKQAATQLVEKAQIAFEAFMADNKMEAFHGLLKKAKGVFIAPQLLKGAFVVGASGGSGVLVVRDKKTGEWNGPAFYTIGGVSFGLQLGGQASEVVLLVMTERGVSSLLSSSLKLGADIGIAAGPVGAGVSASTANLSADILSFSRSKGLYGGISVEGAVVATRGDWNEAYYGKPVTPTDTLIQDEVTNPQAAKLIYAVTKATSKQAAKMNRSREGF
jgi:lipid-binding SYLF domain-containing protein